MNAIKRIEIDADEARAIAQALDVFIEGGYWQGDRETSPTFKYLAGLKQKYDDIHDSLMSAPAVLDNPNRKGLVDA